MATSKVPDERYFVVMGWMPNRLGLKGIPLQLYAIIYGFSQDGESGFEGSLQYLCDFTGATKPTVIKGLKDLVEAGLIQKAEKPSNGVKFCSYRAILPVVKNLYSCGKETLKSGKETLPSAGKETLPKKLDIENLEEILEEKKEEPLFGSELQAAFDDWLRYKTERKDSYTPTGLQNLISEIRNNAAKHGEAAVAALIRKCIASGWKGIIFEKLEEQPRRGGRKEIVPDWASQQGQSEMAGYVKQLRQRTAGEDPEVAARAEALKEKLKGDSNAGI